MALPVRSATLKVMAASAASLGCGCARRSAIARCAAAMIGASSACVRSLSPGDEPATPPGAASNGDGVVAWEVNVLAAPVISVVAAPPLLLLPLTTSIQLVMFAGSVPLPVRSSRLKV